jgi:TonB-linked SusC/RagA family outer membrane protein
VLIRGGSSISASNDPLYVIDGVPINNVPTEPPSFGTGGTPSLPRNPLNLLNPSDIASITVLKDASAAAIYGSRAANGVILIETKKGTGAGGPTIEYNAYVAVASPAKRLDVLNAGEFSQFVRGQVDVWQADSTDFCARQPALCLPGDTIPPDSAALFDGLTSSHLAALGVLVKTGPNPGDTTRIMYNTDWQRAITRSAVTHNHDVSFAGGSEDTRYRASLNYSKQEGVAISNGLERIQGRLNATHQALDNHLRLGLNVTTSRVNNQYITFENRAGFEGGVFLNGVIFNPTQPVTVANATGTDYYETGGASVPFNPVALAEEPTDIGSTTRTIGNATAELDFLPGLTGQVTVGVDHSGGGRQLYYPKSNPWGARLGNGLARQYDLDNATRTLQGLLTLRRQVGESHTLDVVGGYEYTKFNTNLVMAQGIGFFTDAFKFNKLDAAVTRTDSSGAEEWRLVSFLSRANYGFKDRFFVTGVLRYDGSSRFAEGHKWGVFPGLSGSWRLSQEGFLRNGPFSDLRLRVGWGRTGNPSVPPYSSLRTVSGGTSGTYPWGDRPQTGVTPTRNPNPDLRWERTAQYNVALDFGFLDDRLAGIVEYYVKNTSDLLLEVPVPQPAEPATRIENVGKMRNSGLEISLNAVAVSRPGLSWRAGLVFAAERNRIIDLTPHASIRSGIVSGQGQSDVWAQRIMPGHPLGTFYGPVFTRVSDQARVVGPDTVWKAGQQLFRCTTASATCVNGETRLPTTNDFAVIGNANPDFTLGLHNQVNWGQFNVSFLVRAAVGQDVFNNTALVYATKGNAVQDKNFLRPALTDPTGLKEPSIYSSRWVESGSFVRLQNITVEYNLDLPVLTRSARSARLYVSADNLFLITGYSGLDPEVSSANQANTQDVGLAARGIDYLGYPRARTVTGGLRLLF